jgi:hypothetical protein
VDVVGGPHRAFRIPLMRICGNLGARGASAHINQTIIGTDTMTKSSDEILVNTYGTHSPKAARAGVGATTRQEIDEATAAQRASSNANSPRKYSER